jgi:hypothetical protein
MGAGSSDPLPHPFTGDQVIHQKTPSEPPNANGGEPGPSPWGRAATAAAA